MRCIIFFIYLIILSYNSFGQYQILPEIGLYNQSRSFESIIGQNNYYVIGDHIDTSFTDSDSNIWPFISTYNYNGELKNFNILYDNDFNSPMKVVNPSIVKYKKDRYYISILRDLNRSYLHPYLYELNTNTYELKLGTPINSPFDHDWLIINYRINYDGLNTLSFVASFEYNNINYLDLIEYDTLLNIKNRFQVPFDNRLIVPYYIKKLPNGGYILAGDSMLNTNWRPFYLLLDSSGQIQEFRVLEFDENIGSFLSDCDNFILDDKGNWYLNLTEYVHYPDSCLNCYKSTPITLKLSNNFDSILWSKKIDISPDKLTPVPTIKSSILTEKNNIITVGDINGKTSRGELSYGLFYKVSEDGDSLLLRKYQPLGWNEGRALWMQLNDISIAPDGSFIVAATVSDTLNKIVRSWILHLDDNGCLVPNCGMTNIINKPTKRTNDFFKLYPNPVKDNLYIHSLITNTSPHKLSLKDMNNQIIKSLYFNPVKGTQYILNITDIFPGTYILQIRDKKNCVKGQFKIIKI